MKKLSQHISEKLIINKEYKEVDPITQKVDELLNHLEDRFIPTDKIYDNFEDAWKNTLYDDFFEDNSYFRRDHKERMYALSDIKKVQHDIDKKCSKHICYYYPWVSYNSVIEKLHEIVPGWDPEEVIDYSNGKYEIFKYDWNTNTYNCKMFELPEHYITYFRRYRGENFHRDGWGAAKNIIHDIIISFKDNKFKDNK